MKFVSFQGSGSLFILDEPSTGLNEDERKVLISLLKKIKTQGNTIVMVEHSEYLKSKSDYMIELGPFSGSQGGEIIYEGEYKNLQDKPLIIPKQKLFKKFIKIKNIKISNKKNKYSYTIPINSITSIKSSSFVSKKEIVFKPLENYFNSNDIECGSIKSDDKIDKVLSFTSSFANVTSRSTVGSYLGLSTYIRKYYSSLVISKTLNLKEGHFSYNSNLGKCSTCEGRGIKTVEMNFLEDISFTCDDCKGMKLNPLYANISDGYMTFSERSNCQIPEAFQGIKATPKVLKIIEYLRALKIDYLSLDRKLQTLSGGERQRLKFLSEVQGGLENSLILFENISFGLSQRELNLMMEFIYALKSSNNTVVLIDQNPYVIKSSENILSL